MPTWQLAVFHLPNVLASLQLLGNEASKAGQSLLHGDSAKSRVVASLSFVSHGTLGVAGS